MFIRVRTLDGTPKLVNLHHVVNITPTTDENIACSLITTVLDTYKCSFTIDEIHSFLCESNLILPK